MGKGQFSYEILKDCLATFQKAVKSAKSKYFSNLIAKNNHSSKALSVKSSCKCDFKSLRVIMRMFLKVFL